MSRTAASTSASVDTADVGLFGLQMKARPDPIDAPTVASRSACMLLSTGTTLTGTFSLRAVATGVP